MKAGTIEWVERRVEKFPIAFRILSGVALAVICSTLGAIITVHHLADQNRVQELRHNMSSLLAQSEIILENMDAQHRAAAFDVAHLTALAREQAGGKPLLEAYDQTDLYRTIPVVAAWQSVAQSARKEGYQFFTPSRPGLPARNPKNNNGGQFAEAFKAFAAGQTEFFSQDKRTGELTLARPIHLKRSCLACHGDPAHSPTRDGKDVLGFSMEGAALDELKGAFVLRTPMADDPVVRATVKSMALVGGTILVLVIVAFHVMNLRFLVKPLRALIRDLDRSAEQTGQAVQQIGASSLSLAESASQQAASLEETSASLEEIASMVRRNAEGAVSGTTVGRQTREAANAGLERLNEMSRTLKGIRAAVGEMQSAVGEMQSSSQEVSKIIKTIDEIAFQTNLLALNAAVEAARAGEAGAGFAVVADEVRSLAQRSAQAAKDTSEKIETAVLRSEMSGVSSKKVVESLAKVEATAQSIEHVFAGIVTQIQSLDAVISQIASAGQEQNHGVAEVNTAVSQMDKSTQSNAATAEENASAVEELNGQVGSLQGVISRLRIIVSGSGMAPPPPAALSANAPSTNSQSESNEPTAATPAGFREPPAPPSFPISEPARAGGRCDQFKHF